MNETSKVTPFTVVSWKKACECAERWKDLEDCIEKQISVEHADMWAHAVLLLLALAGLGGCNESVIRIPQELLFSLH